MRHDNQGLAICVPCIPPSQTAVPRVCPQEWHGTAALRCLQSPAPRPVSVSPEGKKPTDTLFKAQSGAMESQSRRLMIESPEEATQTLLCPTLRLVLNPLAAFHKGSLPCSSTHFHHFSLSPWENEEQHWTRVLLKCDSLQDNSD